MPPTAGANASAPPAASSARPGPGGTGRASTWGVSPLERARRGRARHRAREGARRPATPPRRRRRRARRPPRTSCGAARCPRPGPRPTRAPRRRRARSPARCRAPRRARPRRPPRRAPGGPGRARAHPQHAKTRRGAALPRAPAPKYEKPAGDQGDQRQHVQVDAVGARAPRRWPAPPPPARRACRGSIAAMASRAASRLVPGARRRSTRFRRPSRR